MYLKSLELAGFKSFAKRTRLDFSSPITAIVGPNGSGKSNVAEAFRFVLGEQSIKSLRGKRGGDLIFTGARGAGGVSRASVAVVFDNTSRFLDIDFDEVTIERIVYRDGANEYRINGSQVRLRDVVLLLAHANIGSSGHHIISQGEADRVLNTNSAERREMIEDALGLKVYQYKKQESEKKLAKTLENIAHIASLRREIAPHLRFLKKQVEKVRRARDMREELRAAYREYIRRESAYLARERVRLAEAARAPEEKLRALEARLKRAKHTLASSQHRDEKSNDLMALEERLSRVRAKREETARELGRIEGQIAFEEKQLARVRSRSLRAESGKMFPYGDVEAHAREAEVLIDEALAEEHVLEIRLILKRLKQMLQNFLSSRRGSTALSDEENEQKTHETELSLLKKKQSDIASESARLAKEEETFRNEHARLQEAIEALADESRRAEREIFSIMTEQNECSSRLGALRAKQETRTREERDLEEEVAEGAVLIGQEVYEWSALSDEHAAEEGNDRAEQEKQRKHIEKLKIRLEEIGGGGGEEIEREYTDAEERDRFLEREITDLERSAASLKTLIRELDEKLNTKFKEGITKINAAFQEFFSLMFGGGGASLAVVREKKKRLTLETEEDEEAEKEDVREGIEVRVSLPRKRIKGLHMLSGGERALTSIALLFAMSQVNPPPFLVLDETDAALDEANSRRYGDMIKRLSRYSQLILITHNRETMSRAGVLYGVTMGADSISRLLSVAFDEAVEIAK